MKTIRFSLLGALLLAGLFLGAEDGAAPWFVEKFGEQLQTASGRKVDAKQVLAGKTVGVYFSASWCGPCRAFTPKLVKFHKEVAKKSNFEIVFVSSDRNEQAMFDYMKKDRMPWYVLPFDAEQKKALKEELKVFGIPTLAVFGKDGKLVTTQGRGDVAYLGSKALARWKSENYRPATPKNAQNAKKSNKKSSGKTSKKRSK
ncbi:MAG: redoxin family protein [Lentisphaeria bacterium]|nr:redoxin family protein [Lentisphaeria bacterium]